MISISAPSVYQLRRPEGFEWLLPLRDADIDLLRFDAEPRARSWTPIKMKRLKVWDDGSSLLPSDFPACSGGDMLMISYLAKDKLGSLLENHGELLPLACDDGDFWTLNVTCLVDAFDERRSEVARGTDTGRSLIIKKHEFFLEHLREAVLFKIPQMSQSGLIYATSRFVREIEESGLVGLEFIPVWTSTTKDEI